MPDLLIRNVDAVLKRQLEERARSHGHSLSEEAKALLRRGLSEPVQQVGLGTQLFSLLPDEFRSDDFEFEVYEPISDPPDFK